MTTLTAAHARLDALAPAVIPTLARLTFAGVLLTYFWASAVTKVGEGPLGLLQPSDGAYIQIFPRAVEAAGYDFSQLGPFHWAVAVAGTWAEILLPLLILVGLLTRLAGGPAGALGLPPRHARVPWRGAPVGGPAPVPRTGCPRDGQSGGVRTAPGRFPGAHEGATCFFAGARQSFPCQ